MNIRSLINTLSETTVFTATAAAAGALFSHSFKLADPVHGAVYCAVSNLISLVVNPIFNAIFIGSDQDKSNDSAIVLKTVLSVICGSVASASIATKLGYAVTLNAGITLTACVLAAQVVAALAVTVLGICLRGPAVYAQEPVQVPTPAA